MRRKSNCVKAWWWAVSVQQILTQSIVCHPKKILNIQYFKLGHCACAGYKTCHKIVKWVLSNLASTILLQQSSCELYEETLLTRQKAVDQLTEALSLYINFFKGHPSVKVALSIEVTLSTFKSLTVIMTIFKRIQRMCRRTNAYAESRGKWQEWMQYLQFSSRPLEN